MNTTNAGSRTRPAIATMAMIVGAGWLLFTASAHAQSTPTPAAPAGEPSPCSATTRMSADPEVVPASVAARVTTTIKVDCAGGADVVTHHHIALVVDASSSITGATRAQVVKALTELVDRVLDRADGGARLLVVAFSSQATVLCELTDQASTAHACIAQLGAEDSSCISCGIRAAHDALARGRALVPPGDGLKESVIVFTDGGDTVGCDAVTSAAAAAKDDRILVATVALSPGGDVPCMRAAATSPRYFFQARAASQLVNVFDTLRRQLVIGKLQRITIRLRESPALRLSFASPSATYDPDDPRLLLWQQDWLPSDGLTISLRLSPFASGAMPVFERADGELLDDMGRAAPIAFEIPSIVVLPDALHPTATPSAAMPVRAHELTLSPPSPKAGERARLDYRLTLDDPTGPLGSHTMIVADMSGSMTDAAPTLRSALHDLVGGLPLGDDPSTRVGLVSFNQAARLLAPLSGDRRLVDGAIDALAASGGTCIDCGMKVGQIALAEGGPAPGVKDLVVFTDGANSGGCPPLVEVADQLKAADVTVHAVCLVPGGCDTACMRAVASPGHYLEAPRVDAIGAAFRSIGDVLRSDRRLDAVRLRLLLAPGLRLIPDAFDLAPAFLASAREGVWSIRPWPRGGFSLHGEVEAVADADPAAPAIAVAEGVGRDGRAVARQAAFAGPRDGTDGPPSPSPTVAAATPSASPASPVATSTASADRLYIPVAGR